MKIWKKNLVAAALLVTVCAGIYANWSYTKDQETIDFADTLNEEKLLSEDMLVMAGSDASDAMETTATDYFAAVRLSRQEARDSAVTMLQEAMAYTDDVSETQLLMSEDEDGSLTYGKETYTPNISELEVKPSTIGREVTQKHRLNKKKVEFVLFMILEPW